MFHNASQKNTGTVTIGFPTAGKIHFIQGIPQRIELEIICAPDEKTIEKCFLRVKRKRNRNICGIMTDWSSEFLQESGLEQDRSFKEW